MTKKSKPRDGSLAFYPKKRAKRETPSFSSFPSIEVKAVKPLNFWGYKAGMVHVLARSEAEKSVSFGKEIMVPCTVLECPPLTVYGLRAYKKELKGWQSMAEVWAEKLDKHLSRKIKFAGKKPKKEKAKKTFSDLEALKEKFDEIRLLVHTNPSLAGFAKKKPDVSELKLSGQKEAQLAFAKEKLGQKIFLKDVFKEKQFVDIKAVDKGKRFSGPVKRFGIKIHRPKAKKHRVVGSIGPWHPATVMWAVARAGQLGYQTRTEYNHRVLKIDSNPNLINPAGGFTNYGLINSDYLILSGSVPGPEKRCIALREPIRKAREKRFRVGELAFISSTAVPIKLEKLKKKKAKAEEKVEEKAEEKKAEKKEVKEKAVEEKKEKKVKEKEKPEVKEAKEKVEEAKPKEEVKMEEEKGKK